MYIVVEKKKNNYNNNNPQPAQTGGYPNAQNQQQYPNDQYQNMEKNPINSPNANP